MMDVKGSRVLKFTVDIVVEPDEDQFHAFAPALKGLHVGGRTEKEAMHHAEDAAIAYLESLIKHGDPIPIAVIGKPLPANGKGHQGIHAHTQNLAVSLT